MYAYIFDVYNDQLAIVPDDQPEAYGHLVIKRSMNLVEALLIAAHPAIDISILGYVPLVF